MSDKVIPFKKKAKEFEPTSADKSQEEAEDFEAIMKKNEENKKRLEKERNKDNKGVIKSHKLKT